MKWRKVLYRRVDHLIDGEVRVNGEIGSFAVSTALVGCVRKVWQAIGCTKNWKWFYATALTKREAKRQLDSYKPQGLGL
jgi:hypothetical protein